MTTATPTSASGSFQLQIVGSAFGRLKTSYQSPLVRSNYFCLVFFSSFFMFSTIHSKAWCLAGDIMARLRGLLLVVCVFSFNKFVGLLHSIVFFFLLPLSPLQKAMCSYTHPRDPLQNHSESYASAKYDFDNPIYQAEDESEEDYEVPGELVRLLQQEDRVIQPHEEQVQVVNLGTDEDRKEIKIGAGLESSVKERLVQMLRDYIEVFAWSYEDMPGLDIDIVVHRLPTKEGFLPVKQKVRRMRPEMSEKIKAEVMKQFNAGFLAVTSYPQWVANMLPVPKKDDKVRM